MQETELQAITIPKNTGSSHYLMTTYKTIYEYCFIVHLDAGSVNPWQKEVADRDQHYLLKHWQAKTYKNIR